MEAAHRKIALNTILLSATEFLTRMVSLVLVIFVARRLGPEMMGIYAFALTFVNFFDIFISFGLERYIQREVGRQPDLGRALVQPGLRPQAPGLLGFRRSHCHFEPDHRGR